MKSSLTYAVLIYLGHLGLGQVMADPIEQNISINTEDGLSLSGRLTIPNESPRGIAVILQGSGNVGYDGDVSGPFTGSGYQGAPAKLSNQLATTLASAGIASIRYNKRGFEDPAQMVHQTMPYIISDAETALAFAKHRFPGLKTAFVGLSEGALVAVHAAAKVDVSSLYLLSLPTRSIDDIFSYQFIQWPVSRLKRTIDGNMDLSGLGDFRMPFLNVKPLELDSNQDGRVSLTGEVIPAFEAFYKSVMGLMDTPAFSDWYHALKAATPFEEIAPRVRVPVYLYQGQEDAQIHWSWIESDKRFFSGATELRRFGGLGHCFAPMDGTLGEIKTSGPLGEGLLEILKKDILKNF